MKKVFLFLSATAMLTVACNKSETVVSESSLANEMTLRAVSSSITKAGELTGISMLRTYGIYAAATQRNAAGVIENATFFADPYEQLFATNEADPSGVNTAAAVADTRLWHAGSYAASTFTPAPIYWPLGKVKMDFLAYAIPLVDHQNTGLSSGVWSATWDNAASDVASQFTFNDVDTYANQKDVLFAAANDQTNAANGGSAHSTVMDFNHAQALLIFNVKVNSEATGKLTINDIEFISDARIAALQLEQYNGTAPGDLAAADVLLKTVGDFCVNNQRNDLEASWSGLSSTAAGYRMPVSAVAAPSASNNVILGQAGHADAVQAYGAAIAYIDAGIYAQLGETLLVPEQPKVNFTIKYTVNDKVMYHKYNDLRGVWQMGKKYIYNLDITMNEIVITESVVDWDPAAQDVSLD